MLLPLLTVCLPSGIGHKDETQAVDEALDATKEVTKVTAGNAETPAAAKPPSRVSNLVSFFEKSTAVHQIHGAKVTCNQTSRLSNTKVDQTELSNAPKQLQTIASVAKEGVDPPWYKPLVFVAPYSLCPFLPMAIKDFTRTSESTNPITYMLQLIPTSSSNPWSASGLKLLSFIQPVKISLSQSSILTQYPK